MSLATRALTVSLGGRPVLQDVTIALDGPALVGIVGPNGAGKSTLLRALLGLVPHDGVVSVDGRLLAGRDRREVARLMAYLPQGQTLHWPLTVERLVGLGRLPHLAPLSRITAEDRAAIATAMDRTGTAHLAGRTATDLSGGERSRVLLARALATEAPILLADEPLAALDPRHQLDVMATLADEARRGRLVLAVLHDLSLAARFCDRVLVLAGGHAVAEGPPARLLTDRLLRDVYGVTAWLGMADGVPAIVPLRPA